ncbi:hypothetical protein ACVRZC_06105 [Streptococcus hyointestinalis]|nr:hypothetical protein [Streptococcus hyointestinalis]
MAMTMIYASTFFTKEDNIRNNRKHPVLNPPTPTSTIKDTYNEVSKSKEKLDVLNFKHLLQHSS